MEFLNRNNEIKIIDSLLRRKLPSFIVLYGRRRTGKSTLLKQVLKSNDVYYAADQSEATMQMNGFAREIAKLLPGFDSVRYTNWDSLFLNLSNSLRKKLVIAIDEFSYLVKNSPELPSILQKVIDSGSERKLSIIICGSAQNLMYGYVMDKSAPLYGRADAILKIEPMKIFWLKRALKCDSVKSVEEYSVWGGIPRYWELRQSKKSFESAIKDLIMDKNGILYEEPQRLLLDDMRSSVQTYSILSLVGSGCRKPSEIASRLNKRQTDFARQLSNLIDLGYLRKDIPFGDLEKNSKKSLYVINDSLVRFYFNYIIPNKSDLELGFVNDVYRNIRKTLPIFFSEYWEQLVREFIPYSKLFNQNWSVARRWWGAGKDKKPLEIDAISESRDKKSILFVEAKWRDNVNIDRELFELEEKIKNFPLQKNRKIYRALFVKNTSSKFSAGVYSSEDILSKI